MKAIHRLEPLAAPGAPPIPGLTPVQSPANASSLAPSASAALNKARTIVIPKVELREATLVEALDFLRTKATELDPDKSGVNIILPPGVDSVPIGSAGARPADARITISLTNVPLDEALRYVTELAGLELRAEPHALVLQLPPVAAPAEAKSAAAPGAAPIVAPAESAALQKAEKIIIPKIETREATLPEMLDFLHAKAIEFDPEKTGVNIVLQPGTESDARITVSLTNIPLSEALRYTASLANLQVRAEPNALVLAPPVKAAAGNPKIEIQGGTLTFNQPSKTAVLAGNTPAATPAPVATDALTKLPVNLTADRTRVENGIAIAEGDARFSGGPYTAKADSIRYNIAQHSVRLTGKVEVQTGANTLTGEDVEVFLDGAGRITAHGPLQTVVRPAGQVAMPVFPKNKKPFTKGDGIEIRELSGSSPTFRVGETYHVRGVCRQNSIQNAVLYLGITAEGDEDAIKPAPGTSLSKTAPKGVTEFDFAFTPLRPGKVHITLYDVDNYNPKDNASEGLYLGEVSL
ncbi:MAG: LptA/OstA family protein [Chthoniobacter sp.]